MISNESSNFKELLFKHGKENVKEKIFNKIKEYEQNFSKRTPIDKIDYTNFNKYLDLAIQMIEHQDAILSFTQQLSVAIRSKLEISKKELDLMKFKVSKEVELLDFGSEYTKTEKQNLMKRELEERLFKKMTEYDLLKMDSEFSKMYVEDAIRSRELAYAYYQGVKMVNPQQ